MRSTLKEELCKLETHELSELKTALEYASTASNFIAEVKMSEEDFGVLMDMTPAQVGDYLCGAYDYDLKTLTKFHVEANRYINSLGGNPAPEKEETKLEQPSTEIN